MALSVVREAFEYGQTWLMHDRTGNVVRATICLAKAFFGLET